MKIKFVKIRLVSFVLMFLCLSLGVYAKSPSFTFKNLDTGSGGRILFDNIKPGEKVQGTLQVSLLENVPTVFKISFVDSLSGKYSKMNLTEVDLKYFSYVDWIKLQISGLVALEGMGKLEVPFVINVPEGALPGDYSGIFIAAVDSYGDKAKDIIDSGAGDVGTVQGTGAKVSVGIALEFFLRVVGDVTPGLELNNVSYFKEGSSEKFNLTLSYSNIGNVILKPRTHVDIKNVWGRGLFSGDFSLPVITPYLDTSSTIKLSTKDFYLDYGVYDVKVDLYYDVFSRELGENLVYFAGTASLRIYYFPWYLFAVLISIIFLIFLVLGLKNFKYYYYLRSVKEYVVKQSDTLQIVSQKYRVDPKKIIIVNKLKSPFFLEPGSKILIPIKKVINEKK